MGIMPQPIKKSCSHLFIAYLPVPAMWAGLNLTIKAYVYRVEIYGNRQQVAVHPRTYIKGKENFCLDHYLDSLIKNRGLCR
jgi:hypothetical protein